MIGLVAVLSFAAAPEPAVVQCPPFVGPDLEPTHLAYYSGFFANQLRLQGVKVTDAAEEADAVIEGRLAPFGSDGVQVDLKVIKAGETIAARSVTAGNDRELFELLRRAAQEIAIELFHRLERLPVPQPVVALTPLPGTQARSPIPGLVAGVLGVAVCGAGVALVFLSKDKLGAVRAGAPPTYAAAMSEAQAARTMSTAGVVMMAVGAAALVGGATYSLVVSRGDAALTMSASPTLGGLALSGVFP